MINKRTISIHALHKDVVVVVYHVTIVAGGHGLMKTLWSMALDCVLRPAGSSIPLNYANLITLLVLLIKRTIHITQLSLPESFR